MCYRDALDRLKTWHMREKYHDLQMIDMHCQDHKTVHFAYKNMRYTDAEKQAENDNSIV